MPGLSRRPGPEGLGIEDDATLVTAPLGPRARREAGGIWLLRHAEGVKSRSGGLFRPGFDRTVDFSADEVSRRIQRLVGAGAGELAGNCLATHFQLTVQEGERHFWSPWLHLEIEARSREALDDRGSTERAWVRGYFTPAPSLWTGFMLLGIALVSLAFFSGTWGLVQIYLGQSPLALLGTLVCALGLLLLVGMSRAGQRLAEQQMDQLQKRVHSALENAVEPGKA